MDVRVEVIAVVVGALEAHPSVLVLPAQPDIPQPLPALPSGPLGEERSLQAGARKWVESQTGHRMGYVEQLYTFADTDRTPDQERTISIGYIGLTRDITHGQRWIDWYDLMPWEDRRNPQWQHLMDDVITPRLVAWVGTGPGADERRARANVTFGMNGSPWAIDMTLARYELLYEAALVPESDEFAARGRTEAVSLGQPMRGDHRRILATAIARVRAKIQYRPVVFELLPQEFTLADLQRCVEGIAGQHVHTQNFRRLVDQQALVEPTGGRTSTGGRPAKLFRFRADVIDARAHAGTKLPTTRSAR